eukprot:CAMPEP_0178428516 /NCGR_PEP_ID=MMETSP0689_2-20121128/30321_1 /TAXON_ID=160604 /ORGANISM="Amphidinium massartii, Strain CS-259" /LENGTH=749 /DNA_ID=CAMNT_0020050297 /DNA_START=47 /DNA_END=2293 /DNA_ORIENTATION=+
MASAGISESVRFQLPDPSPPREESPTAQAKSGFRNKKKKGAKGQAKFKQIVIHKSHRLIRESSLWGWMATHHMMEPTIMVLILLNAVWIGFEVELEEPGEPKDAIFSQVNGLFCAAFTLEIVMRILAYKKRTDFFLDPEAWKWNTFDLVLVILMVLETFVAPTFLGGEDEVENIQGFSAFRLLRMCRIARLVRNIPELTIMVKSLMAALRSVSMTFLLALGVFYVWAIIFTQWARSKSQTSVEYEHFGTLPRSFLTFQQILSFDETFVLIRFVFRRSPMHGMLLLLFILVAAFTILNMLIGVICKIVALTNVHAREKALKKKVSQTFEQMDEDESGTITQVELRNHDSMLALRQVGIDDRLLQSALNIVESHTDTIDLDDLLEIIFKLLHSPETLDVLLVQRKLDKLMEALLIQTSQGQYPWISIRNQQHRHMASKCAAELERRAMYLVTAATSMLVSPEEGSPLDTTSRDSLALEILRLEAALTGLLEHLTDVAAKQEGPVMALPIMWHWQRCMRETIQSLGGVLDLLRTLLGGGRLHDYGYHPIPGVLPAPEPLPLLLEQGKLPAPPGRGPLPHPDPASMLGSDESAALSKSVYGSLNMSMASQGIGDGPGFINKLPEGLPQAALGVVKVTNNVLPGALVQLRGLNHNHDLNGQMGRAKRWHPEVGRWSVILETSGEEKLVAPWNIVVAQAPTKDIFSLFHHDGASDEEDEFDDSSSEGDALTLATDSESEAGWGPLVDAPAPRPVP